MDYGQSVNSQNQPEFFSAGVGTNQEDLNNFEAENNLESGNQQADWGITRDRDTRNIGNIAINTPELPKGIEQQMMPDGEEIPDFDVAVAEVEPPIDANVTNINEEQQKVKFDQRKIRTKDTLDAEGIGEMQNVINKLSQDGNVADFYDVARDMMETNLVNSYGENAMWKGGKAA